ncbi:enoyl-CoA hydratase/isomerase family protein [Luminiphilus sp.]|nr:enoyl-CoA hydratase/isomerase family protein [Luminiphilus sp.]MDB2441657.1 enoyl-CoA hydratase/isomerase family protein [Luminiphilus sp.]MDB2512420.1 enoyl-CoA hydratase/isomerase family protein [Luminiphilus sp.]
MSYESTTPFIHVAVAHHCLTIEFNRPDALNALRPEMLSESARLVQQGSDDEEVSVIVLRGAGRAFSAGVDLKVLQGIKPEGGIIGNVFDEPAALLAAAIRDAGVPVIARAVGACFTGALEVALHCDFVYTTDSSKFGDTHTKFGLRPTWGMSQTLSRAVGHRRARELSFTAKVFSGVQAVQWGVANASFETPEALDEALSETCSRIVGNSSEAVAAMKDLYRLAEEEGGIRASLDAESTSNYTISDTEERLSKF